jgi:chromosome segregation ATPase
MLHESSLIFPVLPPFFLPRHPFRLNLVCGPNGTGKSTILNAMCLGLGGEPRHLGRADDVREFIAHGQDRALIEIELEPHPGKPSHMFRRVMDRNKGSERGRGKGASTFFINGEQTSIKEIKRIVAQEYHISIDNLCTFLPQDRVGSFSGFNSKQLLEETEKSLSGSQHLFDTHQSLISLENELHQGGNNVETMEKKLKKLEADFSNIEREKERMEERQEAVEKVDLLQKKIMWLQYDNHRIQCLEYKTEKDATRAKLKVAQKELAPLEERVALLKSKVLQSTARLQATDRVSQQAKQDLTKQAKKYESHTHEMDLVANSLMTVDEGKRRAARDVAQLREQLEAAEAQIEQYPDVSELQSQMEGEAQEFKALAAPLREKKREQSHIQQDLRDAQAEASGQTQLLRGMNDEKANRKKQVFNKFQNLEKISNWVQSNKKLFRRPVWGPVACELDIKSNNAAAYLEQHIANHILKAFVVECKEDYDLLYSKVRQELNLPVNILTVKNGVLQPLSRLYSDRKYQILKQEHGVVGYLDE